MTPLLIVTILSIAAAAGLIGSFALMRRMTLAADSMSHIALPGLGLAIVLHLNPFLGGLVALLAGAVLIWILESQTTLKTETVIGLVFSTSLAVGALLFNTDLDLLEALFGNLQNIGAIELWVSLGIAGGIVVALLVLKNRLVLSTLVPEISATIGMNNRRINLMFIILFALTLLIGLKFFGILLTGSLVIIPAAAAKNIARNLRSDLLISSGMAVLATAIGLVVSSYSGAGLGPCVVIAAATLFAVSLFVGRLTRKSSAT